MKINIFNKFFCAISLLILVLFSSGCAHRNRVLYNPAPISVGSANVAAVRQAIKTALIEYSWIVEQDSPGRYVVRQQRGRHQARASIDYDRNSVRIKYLDSRDLNYNKDKYGQDRIHGRYNTWITNLERRIAVLLIR